MNKHIVKHIGLMNKHIVKHTVSLSMISRLSEAVHLLIESISGSSLHLNQTDLRNNQPLLFTCTVPQLPHEWNLLNQLLLSTPAPPPALSATALPPTMSSRAPLNSPFRSMFAGNLAGFRGRTIHSGRHPTHTHTYIYEKSSGWNQGRRESLVESASHKRRRDCRGMGREGKVRGEMR